MTQLAQIDPLVRPPLHRLACMDCRDGLVAVGTDRSSVYKVRCATLLTEAPEPL
jgi:hypothetical protein